MLALLTGILLLVIIGGIAFVVSNREDNSDPFRADAIENPPFTSLTYGVQTFIWWDTGFAGTHLDWTRLITFTHVKQTFAWQDIEPERGEWHFENGDRILDQIEARNLQLVVRLSDAPDWVHPNLPPNNETDTYVDAPAENLDDWAEFCRTVATRYAGRISAYQIWNEPNLSREWGGNEPNAGEFVELLRRCSDEIRAADPQAIIISPGLSPTGDQNARAHRDDIFLQELYDADFQQYIDVVGVHSPGYSVPSYGPDDAESEGRGRWSAFRRIEDLRRIMVENDDAARQMAILEMGYTTDPRPESPNHWFAVNKTDQGTYLAEAYEYAAVHWRPWVGLIVTIYFGDPTWTPDNEQYWWSVTDPQMIEIWNGFRALALMPKYCGDISIPFRQQDEAAFALDPNPCNPLDTR